MATKHIAIAQSLKVLVRTIKRQPNYDSIMTMTNKNCGIKVLGMPFKGARGQFIETTMKDILASPGERFNTWWKRHIVSVGITIERLLRGEMLGYQAHYKYSNGRMVLRRSKTPPAIPPTTI